jgi:hypothetical protein
MPPAVVRGVLGEIRTVLTEFVAGLRFEIGASGQLPSTKQTDDMLRAVVGPAVFSNSTVNVFTGNSQAGDIVTDQTRNEYNFGGVKGNVAAGSSNFSQVYSDSFDLTKVREFSKPDHRDRRDTRPESDQRAELEAGASELRTAIDDPAADQGRIAQQGVSGPPRSAR